MGSEGLWQSVRMGNEAEEGAMTDTLEEMLNSLRGRSADRRLDQFEPAVWARIDAARRAEPAGGAWGWRAALAALMLTLGVVSAGIAGASPEQASPFAIHASLAPAILLEGGG